LRTELELGQGQWWRFDAYEVVDGFIRPQPGARLERYDPWKEYRRALEEGGRGVPGGAKRTFSTPYESFLNAMAQVTATMDLEGGHARWVFASKDDETRVLEWVTAHGLLGILPHTFETSMMPLQRGEDRAIPVSRRYFRVPAGWASEVEQHLPYDASLGEVEYALAEDLLAFLDTKPGEAAPESVNRSHENLWPNFYRRGAMVHRELGPYFGGLGCGYREADSYHPQPLVFEPLCETWANYFPDVPFGRQETFVYPLPFSEAFWRSYSEPVWAFMNWYLALRTATRSMESESGRHCLHALLAGVTPSVGPDLSQIWLCPSLLASIAMMAHLDQTQGRLTHLCECGKLFVSSAYQAEYCSGGCRLRYQKRRLRARIKEAAERHSLGESIESIAAALDAPPGTVTGWIELTKVAKRKGGSQ
jgi:hypothetical protein